MIYAKIEIFFFLWDEMNTQVDHIIVKIRDEILENCKQQIIFKNLGNNFVFIEDIKAIRRNETILKKLVVLFVFYRLHPYILQ